MHTSTVQQFGIVKFGVQLMLWQIQSLSQGHFWWHYLADCSINQINCDFQLTFCFLYLLCYINTSSVHISAHIQPVIQLSACSLQDVLNCSCSFQNCSFNCCSGVTLSMFCFIYYFKKKENIMRWGQVNGRSRNQPSSINSFICKVDNHWLNLSAKIVGMHHLINQGKPDYKTCVGISFPSKMWYCCKWLKVWMVEVAVMEKFCVRADEFQTQYV
jgi:hypothetical protein